MSATAFEDRKKAIIGTFENPGSLPNKRKVISRVAWTHEAVGPAVPEASLAIPPAIMLNSTRGRPARMILVEVESRGVREK